MESIASRWKLLSGQENWKNLLEPLDHDLRRYIIQYGENAQATYDTFNDLKISKYAGSSKYAKSHMFEFVGLSKANPFKYKVVKYVYATSEIDVPDAFIMKSLSEEPAYEQSNWMGYVAVATDEGKAALGRRDILIAWRGTIRPIEWVKDFDFPLVSAYPVLGNKHSNANVHQGILSIYTSSDPRSTYNKLSARHQVLDEVTSLVEAFKNEDISITITGHSLGAALSTLNAADIVANGHNKTKGHPEKVVPVTAIVFGSPRVGDSNFRDSFQGMDHLSLLRVQNAIDIVPAIPPIPYAAVGVELLVDSTKSPYLKPGSPEAWHNLEVYLHTVAGTQGPEGGFHFDVKRDISLVNKHSSALLSEYLVPQNWWCQRNFGMAQQNDGSWKLEDHDKEMADH